MRPHHPLTSPSPAPPTPTNDDPDPSRPGPFPGPTQTPASRKKGAGVRAWLVLDSTGQAQVVEAGKHAVMRRTGLPARDLRILDPILSYPSTVLGREKAMVINLEHIKAIITAQEVLLVNSKDPSVSPFVDELQRRILRLFQATTHTQEDFRRGEDTDWTNLYDLGEPESQDISPTNDYCGFPPSNEKGDVGEKNDIKNRDGVKVLPFEFIALEACLEAACSSLDNEARTLEQEAHPALDKLTSKISTLNLERVRQIKSRLVALTGRVQKVRDELEHLLDDDEDMAEMYLTEKLLQQNLEDSSASSVVEHEDVGHGILQSEINDRLPNEISSDVNGDSARFEGDLAHGDIPEERFFGGATALGRGSRGTHTSGTHSVGGKQFDVEELEMLLEAYFVQIDGTLNKLTTLREYVDDTEDYINIMLDDKQNQLLQMGVMLTMATLVVSAFIVVAGIFGMNIQIELFNDQKAGMDNFLWTVGGSTAGTVFLYIVAVVWCKRKRLLE